MVKSFRHKGLEAFAATGDKRGIAPQHAERIEEILLVLNRAKSFKDLARVKGFHSLRNRRAKRSGRFAMSVSGAWRITFRAAASGFGFENLDYCNYH